MERRRLTFATLDEAVSDAEQLLAAGYQRAGNWDLSQCCLHLADWINFHTDGFPKLYFPLNAIALTLRHTVGPAYLRRLIRRGAWPAGAPTDPRTVPAAGGDDHHAVSQLRQAVDQLHANPGPLVPCPLFGDLDKPTVIQLHLLHTAHHLSFLIPNGEAAEQGTA